MDTAIQLCTFRLADLQFGLNVLCVQEVIRSPMLTPVPLAPPMVNGLLNLRGQILTAIDLRKQLRLADSEEGETDRMLMIVRSKNGQVAFVVDSVGDVIEVTDQTFEETPDKVPSVVRPFIEGVHKLPERLLHVLDAEATASILSHDLSA